MGHVLRCRSYERALPTALDALRPTVPGSALTPQAPSIPLSRVDGSVGWRCCSARKARALGGALTGADVRTHPDAAGVDSLNIATAAAIAFYQLR